MRNEKCRFIARFQPGGCAALVWAEDRLLAAIVRLPPELDPLTSTLPKPAPAVCAAR
jgi:hypothetical protein